jgi:hypothetical protein
MSWSIAFVGKPKNVAAAISAAAEKMSGQTKVEFEDAAPHLAALVEQNFNKGDGASIPLVKISASGSGYAKGEEQLQRNINVSIENIYAEVV